jgi:hypothetical protein
MSIIAVGCRQQKGWILIRLLSERRSLEYAGRLDIYIFMDVSIFNSVLLYLFVGTDDDNG